MTDHVLTYLFGGLAIGAVLAACANWWLTLSFWRRINELNLRLEAEIQWRLHKIDRRSTRWATYTPEERMALVEKMKEGKRRATGAREAQLQQLRENLARYEQRQ